MRPGYGLYIKYCGIKFKHSELWRSDCTYSQEINIELCSVRRYVLCDFLSDEPTGIIILIILNTEDAESIMAQSRKAKRVMLENFINIFE